MTVMRLHCDLLVVCSGGYAEETRDELRNERCNYVQICATLEGIAKGKAVKRIPYIEEAHLIKYPAIMPTPDVRFC